MGLQDLTNTASYCTGIDYRNCLNPQGETATSIGYNGYVVADVDKRCVGSGTFVPRWSIPGSNIDEEFSRTAVWGCQFPPIRMNKTDVLVVHPVSVCHNPWDAINGCGNVRNITQMARLLRKVGPAANVQFSWSGDRVIVLEALHPGDSWWDKVIAEVAKRAAGLPVRTGERHIVYGVAHPQAPGDIGGIGKLLGKSAASRSSVIRFGVETMDGVMAHETGHVFGLEHTETDVPSTKTAPGCYNFADTISPAERAITDYFFWPYAFLGNWLFANKPETPSGEVGLDFTRQSVLSSGSTFEMMSYCTPRWVTPWSYRAMYAGLAQAASTGTVVGGRFYEVSGTVTSAGIVFDPVFTVETSGPLDQGSGSNQIAVRGENGSVLYTRSFTPRVATTESPTGSFRTLPYFSELLPEQPGAASISIVDGTGNQLGMLSLGGTPPAVEITFPLGGEVLQGVQNISWSVTDPDSTSHTFWVQYSPDGGASWSTVATSYSQTVLPVDFDSLPGAAGRALIRIYASDGINTGDAVSKAFSVPRKLPQATILYPEASAVLHAGEFLTLEGSGFDPNDGFLTGAALTWSSPSLGGSLGTGEQVTFGKLDDSNIGSHTITLTATGADGSQATTSVNISVEAAPVPVYPNFPPVALDSVLVMNQDTSLSIQLGASDPENGALTYAIGMPAHGTLTGTAPDLLYRPATGYFGPDSFSFSVTDPHGAVSNTATISINVNRVVIDTTAPLVSCAAADGLWHGTNVAITCTAVDNDSGLFNPADASFTLWTAIADEEESSNAATLSRLICDKNNNCATAGPVTGNRVDRKPPALIVSATSNGQQYTSGVWVNTDVVVSFACSDGGSGVNSVTGAQVFSAEQLDASVSGNCRDTVGNESTSTFAGIRIDKTAPNPPAVTVNPQPNADGWHHSVPVVVMFSGNGDVGSVQSGVLRCTAPMTLAAETASTTVTGTCTDLAGNQSASRTITIKIDRTLPTVACSTRPKILWPPNNKLVPVNVAVNVSDMLSGPAGFKLVSVTSNEPDSGLGDIRGFLVGTRSTSGLLRAQRLGSGTGRVYTFTYNGADRAGNSASCAAMVSVPHDEGN